MTVNLLAPGLVVALSTTFGDKNSGPIGTETRIDFVASSGGVLPGVLQSVLQFTSPLVLIFVQHPPRNARPSSFAHQGEDSERLGLPSSMRVSISVSPSMSLVSSVSTYSSSPAMYRLRITWTTNGMRQEGDYGSWVSSL